MSWKVKITQSAKKDITDIKKWYKKESLQALESFIDELISAIETLQSGLIEHKSVYGNYKRILLKKFPYIIYYSRKEAENTVEIKAILHNKREKDFLLKRLYE